MDQKPAAAPTGFQHDYADVNGQTLHYAHFGAGNGRPVFFVHGFPEFWFAWRRQLGEFGRDHHAIAHDMRGYNLSSKPDGVDNYKARHHVEDLAALMGHLGYARGTVVAHDWGGSIAWAFALTYPEKVETLIIVNAPHPGLFARLLRDDPAQQKASGYMIKYRSPDAEEYCMEDGFARMRRGTLDPIMAKGGLTQDEAHEYLKAWSRPGAITAMLNFYRAMGMAPPDRKTGAPAIVPDLTVEQTTVRVPTRVIWGMRDPYLLPQCMRGLPEFVPDLEVHEIPDGTHWVIHEFPDEVNATIRSWLPG
jgi:pimeloyl-ACP methyl ester carboxylesterase